MRFSLLLLPPYDATAHGSESDLYRGMFELADIAEAGGMDTVWVAEHHFHNYGGHIPNPAVLLAALSQRTKRVRLGTGGVAVPLHRPIEVAEQLAMLDILSGGRLRVGVVRAFVNSEFRAYNIDMGESRDRFNEGVEIMIRAWSEERFSYHGKFNRLDNVRLTPKPVQKPYPRIMVGSVLTRESFEYAGRMGFDLGVVPYITPMEAVIEKIGWYHEALRAAGRDPKDHTVMASLHVFVHEDPVKAKEIPREAVPAYVRYIRDSVLDDQWSADYKHYKGMAEQLDKLMDYEVLYEERTLIGTPERVIEKIKAWEAAGVNEISFLIVLPVLSMDEIAHSLRLFTRAVMPAFATTEGVRAAVAGE